MAISPASQKPTRIPAGSTTDPPYGPMADSGYGNPFFYHQFADDFDNQLGASGIYTVTGTGSVVHTPGDGGLALYSSLAGAGTFAVTQLPAANITLPGTGATPPASSTSQKKLFYLVRVQLSDVTLSTFVAGLCGTSATVFAAGVASIIDGLYFYKAPSSTQIQLINVASAGQSPSGAGVSNTFNLPTTAYTLTNGVSIDLAFYIDRNQNLFAYVGAQLVGWIPQSGTGAPNAAGTPLLPVLGPCLANYNFAAQGGVQTPILFTQQNLNITLGVCNGATAAIKTMTSDFQCVQKER